MEMPAAHRGKNICAGAWRTPGNAIISLMRKTGFLLAFLLFPPAVRAGELPAPGMSGPDAAADACATVYTQTVTLVHVTDLHARYQPGPDGVSPYARIRGYFEAVRAENPGALLLDGGDGHEKGSLAEILSSGTASNEATRALRFDVRVLGNHDFAWGEAVARDYMRDPSGPVLGSNLTPVRRSAAPAPVVFVVRQVGCVRVGFFGFLPMPWNEADETYPGGYPGFNVDHDYAAAARRVLQTYAGEADLIVMLSHLGNADDLRVAEKTPGIDLVLGGHTHDWTWTPKKAGTAVVTETGPYAEFVTRVDLAFDLRARRVVRVGHELRRVEPGLPADPAVQAAIGGILRRYAPDAARPVACALRDATPLIAAAAAARAVTGLGLADAAVADSKSVWKPWKAGPLAAQDFLDAFAVERQPPDTPGINAFYTARISGAALSALAARADGSRWAYAGPRTPDKRRSYLLALPKRAAARTKELLPGGVDLAHPRFLMEVWEVLDRWGRSRGASVCLDAP